MSTATTNPLQQTPLQKLFSIDGFGRRRFNGQHFSIKFRVPKNQDNRDKVGKIKAKHPNTIVHYAETTEFIIFGGTYSCTSSFLHDIKTILKLKVQ